jgi:predicted amidohydrolase
MKDTLKLAVIQLNSNDSQDNNWDQIWSLLENLMQNHSGIHLISLPENALFLRVSLKDQLQAITMKDPKLIELQNWAIQNELQIHLGAAAVQENKKIYNATIWLGQVGGPKVVYKKIHLFDVEVGGQSLKESDDFASGSEPAIIEFMGWRLGLSICYDIRFPELYLNYAKNNVDLILVPAAFLKITGGAHWHTLLKARAIETQAYLVAAAQCGVHTSTVHNKSRETYGHSLVISPWGEILTDNQELKPSFQVIQIEKSQISKVRAQIPISQHRKL